MYEFPFELDDFQKEACDYISEGKSVVVCAPTGAGKTVIAQHAIHEALKNNTRVFYTTPLKALSNQKYYDFSERAVRQGRPFHYVVCLYIVESVTIQESCVSSV